MAAKDSTSAPATRKRRPPPAEPTALAKRLQEIMNQRGLSGRGLSEAAGLALDAVRNITKGRSEAPRMDTLEALAGAMAIPVAVLIDPSLPVPPPSPTARAQPIPRGRYSPLLRQASQLEQPPAVRTRPLTMGDMVAAPPTSVAPPFPPPKAPPLQAPTGGAPGAPAEDMVARLADRLAGAETAPSPAPAPDVVAVPELDVRAVPPSAVRTWTVPRDVLLAQGLRPEAVAVVRAPSADPAEGVRRGDILLVDLDARSGSPPGLHVYGDGLAPLVGTLRAVRGDERRVLAAGEQVVDPVDIVGRVVGRIAWL